MSLKILYIGFHSIYSHIYYYYLSWAQTNNYQRNVGKILLIYVDIIILIKSLISSSKRLERHRTRHLVLTVHCTALSRWWHIYQHLCQTIHYLIIVRSPSNLKTEYYITMDVLIFYKKKKGEIIIVLVLEQL